LFGVARRVATAARRREDRRARLVRRAAGDVTPPNQPPGWDDLLATLDEELARLPDKYRAPLLACYLDGRTQDEAARQLGWSVSTLRRRLEAARDRLRVRMTARGATLGGGLFAGVLSPAPAAVPDPLARATVEHAAGGSAPARVLELAALTGPPLLKCVASAALLLITCGLAVGLGGRADSPIPPPRQAEPSPRISRAAEPADPLPRGAVARMGSPRFRHPVGIQALDFALGGKVVISTGNPTACIWDTRTGKLLRTLGSKDGNERDETGVWGPSVSADGRSLTLRRNWGNSTQGIVWDLERDAEIRTVEITPHPGRKTPYVYPRLVAPDGSRMAEADSQANTVWLWDKDGKPAGRLEGAIGEKERWWHWPAAFAPDGNTFYAARLDHTIEAWDTATCKRVRTFGTGKPRPRALAVSADGKYLATFAGPTPKGGHESSKVPEAVRVWDPARGDLIAEFPWEKVDPNGSYQLFLGFLPDGMLWAATSFDDELTFRQWDRETGRQTRQWTAPLATRWSTSAVALAADGTRLAVACGGVILMFDATTGKDLTPAGGHRYEIGELRFTPDGRQLVTVGADEAVRTWEAATGKELRSRSIPGEWPIRLSHDAAVLFNTRSTGGREKWDPRVTARELATGRELWTLPHCAELVPHPDGKTVWGHVFDQKHVAVVDTTTGKTIRTIPLPARDESASHLLFGWVYIAFGDAGRLVVCASGKEIIGYDSTTGRKRFAWSPIAAGLLRDGTPPNQPGGMPNLIAGIDFIAGIAVSPDGKTLVLVVHRNAGEDHGSISICEAATGTLIREIKLPVEPNNHMLQPVAVSPDGTSIALVSWKARLYDLATGKETAVLDGHRWACRSVAFSPDGKYVATGGADGTAVVWDLPRK
ncbi:MAG: hypothetical protein JWO38_5720, partial [Gemmataceae bacterium]|nr:hypothetical protein [Gemmataceae bacterium]